jgi:hypothetical protein
LPLIRRRRHEKSWFTHTGLTTEEANELVARYSLKAFPLKRASILTLVLDSQRITASAVITPKTAAKPAFPGMGVIVKSTTFPVGKASMTRAQMEEAP